MTEPNKRELKIYLDSDADGVDAWDLATYREYLLKEVEFWMSDVLNPDLTQREGFTRMIRRLREGA